MTDKEVAVGYIIVRIWHPNKELNFISSMLSMPKMRSWVAGSPRKTPTGRVLEGSNKESYWCSEQHMFFSDDGFNDVMNLIIERLVKAGQSIINLKNTGGKIELYLQLPGSVNNGGIIESLSLKTLGELGVDLLLEVFPKTSNSRDGNPVTWKYGDTIPKKRAK